MERDVGKGPGLGYMSVAGGSCLGKGDRRLQERHCIDDIHMQ